MSAAHPTLVFPESHIQDPMQPLLHMPMRTYPFQDVGRIGGQARNLVGSFLARLLLGTAPTLNHGHRAQTRPAGWVDQACLCHRNHPAAPPLDSPVPTVGVLGESHA